MNVLIIEDDEFKQRRITQAVLLSHPDAIVSVGRSVNSGLACILETHPDVVLLDMSLTTFDIGPGEPGGRPQNFGGMEILRQMDRLQIVVPVIVITQHERFATGSREVHLSALHRELTEQHSTVFKGLIYYNSARGDWQRLLRQLLKEVFRPNRPYHGNANIGRRR
jgi:DNA-binding NarL/FixJ family response regulator